MKKVIRILSALLLIVFIFPSVLILTYAEEGEQSVSASIDVAYGGAKGIVTLTFDDGDYETALALQTLCDKYDLSATLMLVAGRVNTDNGKTVEEWNKIFAGGRIEPQSHSMTHVTALGVKNEDILTTSFVENEIVNSKETLDSYFPNADILCLAPQGGANKQNCLTDYARELAMSTYYMIRGAGETEGSATAVYQSLSPSLNFGELGSWSYVYSPSVDNRSLTELKNYIDNTVKEGAWFCSYGHKIQDVAGERISAYDTMESWFAYIDQIRDKGDIWVTTISSAVKYMRERQNSTVSAYSKNGSIIVSVDMANETADGLSLSADVFNQPLSVKVEVPDTTNYVRYVIDGECRVAKSFSEGEKRYVRVDVIPGTTATLDACNGDTPHDLEYVAKVSPTCLGGGTIAHYACKGCGGVFDKKGNPLETIESDAIGSHDLVDVPGVDATETEEGIIAHKVCSNCGKTFSKYGKELDNVSIPVLTPSTDTGNNGINIPDIGQPAIIAAILVIVIIVIIIIL